MGGLVKIVIAALIVLIVLGAGTMAYVVTTGLSARPHPGALEIRIARAVRGL